MEGQNLPPGYAAYQRNYGVGPSGPAPRRVRFDTIAEAWQVVIADWATWVGIMLMMIMVGVAVALPPLLFTFSRGGFEAHSSPYVQPTDVLVINGLFQVLSSAFVYVLMAGVYGFGLRRLRGEDASFGDIFNLRGRFGPLFGAGLVLNVVLVPLAQGGQIALALVRPSQDPAEALMISFAGLMIGLIGLVIVSLLATFTPLLIVDKGMGALEAIGTSFRTALPHFFSIFGLLFVAGLIMLVGVFACGVGILISAPIAYMVQVGLYNDFFRSDSGPNSIVSDPNMMNPPTFGSL